MSDSTDLTVLYVPTGSMVLGPTSNGIPERDDLDRVERILTSLETGVWNRHVAEAPWPTLLLCPRDAWWYASITWPAPDQPLGWKIDAARPLQRTSYGYDSMDLILDILAEPDLSSWVLKDEDELHLAEQRGLLGALEMRSIRMGIEEAAQRLEDRRPPFDVRWLEWSPDPAYPIPVLPDELLNTEAS